MSIQYQLIRSSRRTLAIQITLDARVVVRAPKRAPQAYIDAFVASRESWIAEHLLKQQTRLAAHPEPTPEEVEALRRRAKAELPPLIAHWAQIMGVTPTGFRVTSARTRFGSCSGKDSLNFSLYLMQYPPAAIEAVVVHELSHIRHKNHSQAFYAEVLHYLPDYWDREKLLKQ